MNEEKIKRGTKKEKKYMIAMITTIVLAALGLQSCGSSSSSYKDDSNSSGYKSSSSSKDDYDYDKGYGYTKPKEGESVSDYIKRQDPELYNEMKRRYDSLK